MYCVALYQIGSHIVSILFFRLFPPNSSCANLTCSKARKLLQLFSVFEEIAVFGLIEIAVREEKKNRRGHQVTTDG
jgi:hypothetical protein